MWWAKVPPKMEPGVEGSQFSRFVAMFGQS